MRRHLRGAAWLGLLCVLFLSMMNLSSRPPGAIGPYLNGVFPEVAPGASGAWYLEEVYTEIDIAAPLRIIDFPGTEDVLILCKTGKVWRVNLETQTQSLVLDISDRTVNYSEAGAVSLVLHPEFGDPGHPDKQTLFVFYRYKPQPRVDSHLGYNRLSKFSWDATGQTFDGAREEILIQQYDRNAWHNGGGLFFADGLLYLALGDEGGVEYREGSNQRLNGGLFGGLMRIDVDNDPARSHPIRRQPVANDVPPAGWTDGTFTQGYSIPNDNPWLSAEGERLEEYFALGIRSPYSTHYDPETGTIWLGDVGAGKREEINRVEKGDNLQWNYLEGSEWAGGRPGTIIGKEKPPLFQYGRDLGGCIIGGGVYRGRKFPSLTGRYLFGDYVSDKLMALRTDGGGGAPAAEILLSDFGPEPVDLPASSVISGVHYRPDGDILLTTIAWPFVKGGRILQLRQRDPVPDPPALLSELGVFTDLATLEVGPGILPYAVNAPLWSDRAVKDRWMAIPNDGTFDGPEERIRFSATEDWEFPEGTVFIKHFELPTTTADDGPTTRLETRFFVIARNGTAYGLTYRWNAEQTDAVLQYGATDTTYTVAGAGTQRWDFPGRDQCMTCHNANAGYVLGVKTHQLNGDLTYPGSGATVNQLAYLSEHGVITVPHREWDAFPRAYGLYAEPDSLDLKIRSYLDANCASCHRVGGVSGVTMDLRFHTPLELRNLIDLPTLSQSSGHGNLIVQPGRHWASELWLRDQSRADDRMPPLGSNLVDEDYVRALADWIDGMAYDREAIASFITFPNPSPGWMMLVANADWKSPLQVDVFSLDGKLVHQETHENLQADLRLQRVGRGTFVLRVRDAEGRSASERIVLH